MPGSFYPWPRGDRVRSHRHATELVLDEHDAPLLHEGESMRLDRFGDLAGLETTCAHVVPGRLAVEDEPDALQVRVEPPLRGDHRVRPAVPGRRPLPTDCADPRHAAAECSSGSSRDSDDVRPRQRAPSGMCPAAGGDQAAGFGPRRILLGEQAQRAAAARRLANRSAISSAVTTASAPLAKRGSAWSGRSSVSTPKATGTPVSIAASWSPDAASLAT